MKDGLNDLEIARLRALYGPHASEVAQAPPARPVRGTVYDADKLAGLRSDLAKAVAVMASTVESFKRHHARLTADAANVAAGKLTDRQRSDTLRQSRSVADSAITNRTSGPIAAINATAAAAWAKGAPKPPRAA